MHLAAHTHCLGVSVSERRRLLQTRQSIKPLLFKKYQNGGILTLFYSVAQHSQSLPLEGARLAEGESLRKRPRFSPFCLPLLPDQRAHLAPRFLHRSSPTLLWRVFIGGRGGREGSPIHLPHVETWKLQEGYFFKAP